MAEPSEVIEKAKELYDTAVETITDPELYKDAVDTLTDPELYATAATKAKDVYASASTLLDLATMDEIALLAVTVLPALCAAATILVIVLRKIFCCPRSAKISAAAPTVPAPARPQLVSRPTVVARNKKDAPPGSIGHATLGHSAKNPKAAPAAAKAGKPAARGGPPPSTGKKGSGKGFSA